MSRNEFHALVPVVHRPTDVTGLQAEALREVEDAVRTMDGVAMASALRGDQPYVVVECPTILAPALTTT